MSPTAAIIIIGNEILAGHTREENIPFLAGECSRLGIALREVRVVPDVELAIVKAVNECRAEYQYVFTTGGIGPTHDDITADSVAAAFGVPCEENADGIQRLQNYYRTQGIELNEARRRMARMPRGASIIENPVSSAPGFRIGNVFVMAGVPNIMQQMFKGLIPQLVGGPPILTRSITCRLMEGNIADDLTAIQNQYAEVDIGSYPAFRNGAYQLKLVLRTTDQKLLDQASSAITSMAQKHGDSAFQIQDW
ncbi:MAG: competence/damage-inducible protein A [Alphaproteobacteria bacterium]|nr:MAG: competence/damage-inducible protein A [Alphaproteobacteria bacterium]